MKISFFEKKNLQTQGFQCDDTGFVKASPWLRLNPMVCFAGAVLGLWMESAAIFFILAGLAAVGVFFRHGVGDLFYNYILRYLTRGTALPSNPPPRRFACFVGMLWSLGIAFSFLFSYIALAYALTIAFFIVVIPMIAIHYCVASVIYQKVVGYKPR